MDINELYARHQISLMRSEAAACRASRHAHRALAAGYALRIAAVPRPGLAAGVRA